MNTRQRLLVVFSCQNRRLFFLTVIWLLGILLGIAAAIFSEGAYCAASLAVKVRPKLGFLYLFNGVPVAVLMALLVLQFDKLLFAVMLLFGLFRGFCGMFTVLAFGSGGWLVRGLLLFSSGAVAVLMWWLIFSPVGRKSSILTTACVLTLYISAFTLFDFFVISPFLIGIC